MKEKFRNKIEQLDWDNPDAILDFHKNNTIYIGQISITEDLDLLFDLVDFELSYIHALDRKKHYTIAFEYLKEIDILVQRLKELEYFYKINERYLFAFGVIAHRLNKYELSGEYFSQLTKLDPNNNYYSDWYYGNYTKLFAKKANILIIIGLASMVLNIFSRALIYIDPEIRLWISIGSVLLIIIGYAAPYIRTFLLKHNIRYY